MRSNFLKVPLFAPRGTVTIQQQQQQDALGPRCKEGLLAGLYKNNPRDPSTPVSPSELGVGL